MKQWFRLVKATGAFEAIDLVWAIREMVARPLSGSVLAGAVETDYAYYWDDQHLTISCGCCRGPVADRCVCSHHQDVAYGQPAHKCTRHLTA